MNTFVLFIYSSVHLVVVSPLSDLVQWFEMCASQEISNRIAECLFFEEYGHGFWVEETSPAIIAVHNGTFVHNIRKSRLISTIKTIETSAIIISLRTISNKPLICRRSFSGDRRLYQTFNNFLQSCLRAPPLKKAKIIMDPATLDSDLASIPSLVFDHYAHNAKIDKSKAVKSRSHMVMKVILSTLNLSISHCPRDEEMDEYDLEFLVDTVDELETLSETSELFDPGDIKEIMFMSSRLTSRHSTFVFLIDPLGKTVFIATIICTFLVGGTLLIGIKIEKFLPKSDKDREHQRRHGASSVVSVVIRPLLDQCEECHMTVPSQKVYFRLILLTWLLFCLIITETYRSELINHLMKPKFGSYWLESFQNLSEDDRNLFGFNGRFGHEGELFPIFVSEMEHTRNKELQKSLKILTKRLTPLLILKKKFILKSLQAELSRGSVSILAESFLLDSVCNILDNQFGGRYYELSKESIKNKRFWSVLDGPYQASILSVYDRLRDGGILEHFQAQQDMVDYYVTVYEVNRGFLRRTVYNPGNFSVEKFLFEPLQGPKQLKFKHIHILLILLVFGVMLSSLGLIYEALSKCITNCCNTRNKKHAKLRRA